MAEILKSVASGWFIDDIELPIQPNTDQRSISRSFQSETLFQYFPSITKSSASAFDYTMTGLIYPEIKAFALDQIAKSADTNVVIVTIPVELNVFATSHTKYAVKKLVMDRDKPLFVKYNPRGSHITQLSRAFKYTLTLTELPDDGEVQEGIDGFTDTDEGALGLQQLNELNEQSGSGLPVEDFGPVSIFVTDYGFPIAL